MNKRIADFGVRVGAMRTGALDKITDVPGVRVGHYTLADGRHQTGVTVVLPCEDDPFARKLTAASFVQNGFGKTLGLVQLDELGSLETPIALTNTLGVGKIHDAMVAHMLKTSRFSSINPVVCECNDAYLNDIADRALGEAALEAAFADAREDFEEGAVGAGRGMSCFGWKGGIGSASRLAEAAGEICTLGVLALSNFGRAADLRVDGRSLGDGAGESAPERGSCILVMATDLPLTDRQLRRVLKRGSVGLARVGSFLGHGSGDVYVGFTTKNRLDARELHSLESLNEERIDVAFRAMAEATEEAVLNSLAAADDVTGFLGRKRESARRIFERKI